jgi:hypothetical protein
MKSSAATKVSAWIGVAIKVMQLMTMIVDLIRDLS